MYGLGEPRLAQGRHREPRRELRPPRPALRNGRRQRRRHKIVVKVTIPDDESGAETGELTFINNAVDQTTGNETQITSDPADDVNPYYSPDLKWLVFQSNRNGNWDLFIINVETGTEVQLTNSPSNETFPAWSPNGKQIAFLANTNGATDLYVMDLDGQNLKRLTVDGKTNNATWSPEGNRIAYQSERNGNLDIYSFDLTKDQEYRVTDYEGVDSGPTWDCGGTNLAFTSIRDGNPNVFQVFWQGGGASNMTIDPATDKWSQWRPSNDVSSTGS